MWVVISREAVLKAMGLVVIAWRGEKGVRIKPEWATLGSRGRARMDQNSLDKEQSRAWVRHRLGNLLPKACRPAIRGNEPPVNPHRHVRPYLGDLHTISDTVDTHFVDLICVGMQDDLRSRQDGIRLKQRNVPKD